MRVVFLTVTFCFSFFNVTAQTSKLIQIKAIYDEGPACFQKYLGKLIVGTDTLSANTYSSSIAIEGTFNNEILRSMEGCMYSAQISDFVAKKEAQDIVENWISELKKSFRPFKKEKRKVFGQIDVIAYEFREDKYSISIHISSRINNPAKAIVMIYISYYP